MEVDEDEIAEGMILEDDSIGMMVVDTDTVIDTKIDKRQLERNEERIIYLRQIVLVQNWVGYCLHY